MWSLGMVRGKSVEVCGELLCGFLDFTAPRFWEVRAGDLHALENGVPFIRSPYAIDEDFVELCAEIKKAADGAEYANDIKRIFSIENQDMLL